MPPVHSSRTTNNRDHRKGQLGYDTYSPCTLSQHPNTLEHMETTSDIDNRISSFGSLVRTIRLAKSLSQENLAELCKLDRTYIGGIERGERNPTLKNIFRLADALDTSPRTFFDTELESR